MKKNIRFLSIFLLPLCVLWIFSCSYSVNEEQIDLKNIESMDIVSKFLAPEPVHLGYSNWATCTASSNLKVLNDIGPKFAQSNKVKIVKYGQSVYVQDIIKGTNNRYYAKLPGWGTYRIESKNYGFADIRWLTKGYMVTPRELHNLIKKEGYTDSTEERIFLCKNRTDAEIIIDLLQACYSKAADLFRQGWSDTKISANIKRAAGTIPVIGNLITFLSGGIDDNMVIAGGGKWKLAKSGDFYKIYFLTY